MYHQEYFFMRKNITILGTFLLVGVIFLTGCAKDEIETNQKAILGTWISTDKSDTLHFTTQNDFYHSNGQMVYNHYDYELFKDSVQICYRGELYIYVTPTMHSYSMDKDQLIIDFSNRQCYGFPLKKVTYTKEK